MARYIDAEKVTHRLFGVAVTDDAYGMAVSQGIDMALKIINDTPTADVAEVKHGEWEDRENPQWRAYEIRHCSVCGWNIHKTKLRKSDLNWSYCPNCGAKMDGKDGEQ